MYVYMYMYMYMYLYLYLYMYMYMYMFMYIESVHVYSSFIHVPHADPGETPNKGINKANKWAIPHVLEGLQYGDGSNHVKTYEITIWLGE